MEKSIRNADVFAYKLKPALSRTTNQKFEVVMENRRKKTEMVKQWKVEAMVIK